ncbi:UNVERIFIED_CONTAM: cAMP-regulated phosphoprotein 21 [Sesamum indicum]
MEGSATASSAAADEGPESWEVADVDASMRRLMLSSRKDSDVSCNKQEERAEDSGSGFSLNSCSVKSDDLVNTVDQFLRDALQNPRERLSVLRMEQDVEKFIRDPTREQMEFQQLPTSYLRLAAHRVAQHYSLESMVLFDNNLPEGSSSRIIVRKTSNIRLPSVRLADVPVNLPTEDSGAIKVAIKQRPQKGSHNNSNSNMHSVKSNSSKSVEERKEEYNRARARIFSSNSSGGSSSGKPESDPRIQDGFQHGSLGITKAEERVFPGGGPDMIIGRSLSDSSTSSSRISRSRTEKEPIARPKTNNKVAIFRDREVDRKDPDYDRSYDRYVQRFDPGFGFSGGPYTIQPMYAPALNYNTEFPQLGSTHRPQMSSEHQPRPLPQHMPGPWVAPSAPAGIGYGPAETMLSPFSSGHINARSNSGLYLQSTQYPCQRSGLPYIHPLDPIHQSFSRLTLQDEKRLQQDPRSIF